MDLSLSYPWAMVLGVKSPVGQLKGRSLTDKSLNNCWVCSHSYNTNYYQHLRKYTALCIFHTIFNPNEKCFEGRYWYSQFADEEAESERWNDLTKVIAKWELNFIPKSNSKTWDGSTLSDPWDVDGIKLIGWFSEDELLLSNDIL